MDSGTIPKGEEAAKPVMVMLVGAPGSGKSTFCEHVMRSSTRPWVRVCQDTIGNGKAGTKAQCLQSAAGALKDGKSVFIDRCNIDREQRAEFLKLGCSQVDVHAMVLDLPARLCISRTVKRAGHEGNLQGGRAAAVVNKMLQRKELPNLSEGFSRITFCQDEAAVQDAVNAYAGLGPLASLPSGCHGQKSTDAKIQLGIMKFLKKVDTPVITGADTKKSQDSTSAQSNEKINMSFEPPKNVFLSSGNTDKVVEEGERKVTVSAGTSTVLLDDVPTLAFPSISTADFQFNLEKASDIIIEKAEEFTCKLENARLVLVDLSHGSRVLSLVRAKAAQKNIDPRKFFAFVGDITQLYTKGGLRCNVIANAANWRLKPGGGGVNAAIFSAAGPALDVATKERAGSLLPGKSVTVSLPSSSPLCSREGVTHVIHVLGPNMNPNRPNCLSNDYIKGCKILREAYASLFESFVSLVMSEKKNSKESSGKVHEVQASQDQPEGIHISDLPKSVQKAKWEGDHDSEKNKKCKAVQDVFCSDKIAAGGRELPNSDRVDESIERSWTSWAQALFYIAMHPERHKNDVLEILDDVVVLNDLYPKAKKHVLVMARRKGLDSLADVQKEHLSILETMNAVGLKWAEKFLCEEASLVFRLGYHSAPSMRQLHLHLISQDFESKHLKNKKHWNSFNTAFFRDSVDVIQEISNHGKATLRGDDSFLTMELRCHRCRSAHPNLPRLKSHISRCQAPFPSTLLQNGRLVLAKPTPIPE